MKKIFTAMALSLAITLSFGLAACNNQPSSGGSANGGNGKFNELNTTESVYGFSAASAGMIISSMNAAGTTAQTVQILQPAQIAQASQSVGLTSVSHASASRVSATNLCSVAHVCAVPVNSSADDAENAPVEETPDTSETPDVSVPETPETPDVSVPETPETPEKPGEQPSDSPETAELDRYMALVESLLSDGGFDFSSQTSDREEYAEKTVISYKDMSGDAHDYVMYFNQTLTKSETDESDGETEENYSIKGVMVIDGADYEIRGERKNESEEGESETETEFVVILGENRYIRVEQSVETEDGESEQEYCYSVYENGKLVERSEFSYETEENETELKMTSFKDGKTQVLYFEREIENGEEVIEIHVGDGKHGKGYIVHIEKDENGDNRYSFIPTDFDD